MASGYSFRDIEAAWQQRWEAEGTYRAHDDASVSSDQAFFGLVEFPYPSGDGLHVGHPRSYTAIDIVTRKKRMEGKNVLYPIGWDAFGLPTENYAIKHKVKPQDATKKNVANFTRQIKSIGFGFDWSREINTTDPAYYKWTQWMFLQFFNCYFDDVEGRARPISQLAIPDVVRSHGDEAVRRYIDGKRMAYKAESTINWCPRCKIGLANEEAQGGVCERCGHDVEQRQKAQWMIRITKYADRLIDDLSHVDYLEKIATQQIHWIGRSEGAYVDFGVTSARRGSLADTVTVFTTRPDTLFGVTYLVLAPEHPLIETWIAEGDIENVDAVRAYQKGTSLKSDLQRQENKEKTGVILEGIRAKNPANGEMVAVWVADYVLGGYGTGAIMAVPAHDERDLEFAQTFGLEIRTVVDDQGVAVNSGMLDGLATADAKVKMIEWLETNQLGQRMKTYRLRDWVFSRQRYWGEPIPIVICKTCGYVPVPESQLPITLPEVEAYEPTDTGESPLAAVRSWVEVACPHCGGPAERETDTMPNWAGSSWYFLRYCDPQNDAAFASPEKLKFWMPVDLYNGGMEHTTLHLLYSRFWYKVLFDLNHIPRECGNEPYRKRRSHALILGEGGIKMSKSKGNVVNPDEIVEQYGADVFRTYEMFIGPYDQDAPWDTNGIEGVKRFLDKVFAMYTAAIDSSSVIENDAVSESLRVLYHQSVKKVGEDIELLRFNTAVSSLMILSNELLAHFSAHTTLPRDLAEGFLQLLAPFAPHLTDELWSKMGKTTSIHLSGWPTFDPSKLSASTFELVIQVNGKVRDRVTVDAGISEDEATKLALASEKVIAALAGQSPKKVVYVKGRLVSVSF